MQAAIIDRYSHLNMTDAGREAVGDYLAAIEAGHSHCEAEIIGSNTLQRAGYGVNETGGASFAAATIDHNDRADARVHLVVDRDERGYFVATRDGEDTGPRFGSAGEAYDSIFMRWGHGWGLELV